MEVGSCLRCVVKLRAPVKRFDVKATVFGVYLKVLYVKNFVIIVYFKVLRNTIRG